MSSNVSDDSQIPEPTFENTILMKLPKFSDGYQPDDFYNALIPIIGKTRPLNLCRLKYPNEWTLTVIFAEFRVKLLRKGCITVKGKKCVIQPYAKNEVCGRIHWMPSEISNEMITHKLRAFGTFVTMEDEKVICAGDPVHTCVRFFVLRLKEGTHPDDVPHFIEIGNCDGLVTIKGRDPMCFGCRGIGHRKAECLTEKRAFKSKPKSKKRVRHTQTRVNPALLESSASPDVAATGGSNDSSVRSKPPAAQLPQTSSSSSQVSNSISTVAQKPQENLSGVVNEVNNLQNIVNIFSKRLVDALSTVTETVIDSQANGPSTSTEATGTKKSKKKKKKKKKKQQKSDSYDVAAAEQSNFSHDATEENEISRANDDSQSSQVTDSMRL